MSTDRLGGDLRDALSPTGAELARLEGSLPVATLRAATAPTEAELVQLEARLPTRAPTPRGPRVWIAAVMLAAAALFLTIAPAPQTRSLRVDAPTTIADLARVSPDWVT